MTAAGLALGAAFFWKRATVLKFTAGLEADGAALDKLRGFPRISDAPTAVEAANEAIVFRLDGWFVLFVMGSEKGEVLLNGSFGGC